MVAGECPWIVPSRQLEYGLFPWENGPYTQKCCLVETTWSPGDYDSTVLNWTTSKHNMDQ